MPISPQLIGVALVIPSLLMTTQNTIKSRSDFSSKNFDDVVTPVLGPSQFAAFALYCYHSGRRNQTNMRSDGSQGVPFDLVVGMLMQGGYVTGFVPKERQQLHQRFYGSLVLYGCYMLGMRSQRSDMRRRRGAAV
jgi:hypothetical protein